MAVCNFSDLIVLLVPVPTSFLLILPLTLALMMMMMMTMMMMMLLLMMMMMMPESQRVPTILITLMIKQDKMNLEHSYSYYIIYIHQSTNEQTVKNMPKKT
jgi:hypothetical protein